MMVTRSRNMAVLRMHNDKIWTCDLGYGADTMFHRTYFLLLLVLLLLCKQCLVSMQTISDVEMMLGGSQAIRFTGRVCHCECKLTPQALLVAN